MSILVTVLLSIASIIALLLILALFMKKEHYVKREIIINAPTQKVFDFLRLLKNQDEFNQWATVGPDRVKEFKGTDGTVGFVYSWKGGRMAGEGEKEIMNIVEGKKVETEIRFTKPMEARASVIMETEPLPNNQTKVNFTNAGTLRYPLNIMIPMAEKNFARDMDISLATLKKILENKS